MDKLIYTSLARTGSPIDRVELYRVHGIFNDAPLNYVIVSKDKKNGKVEEKLLPLTDSLPDIIRACDERAK